MNKLLPYEPILTPFERAFIVLINEDLTYYVWKFRDHAHVTIYSISVSSRKKEQKVMDLGFLKQWKGRKWTWTINTWGLFALIRLNEKTQKQWRKHYSLRR